MKITHPRPEAGRQTFIGVEFRDGVAFVDELHPERRLALIQHGATIEEEPILDAIVTPLADLTKAELQQLAAANDTTVPPKATKAAILDLLKAHDWPEIGDGDTLGGDDA